MNPARFVTENHAPINDRRGAPDRRVRFVAPDQLALVSAQAMHKAVARADIDAVLVKNGTGPNADRLAASARMATLRYIGPDWLTCLLFVSTHDAVFGSGVDQTVRHGRRRIRISTDARFPNHNAVFGINTVKVVILGAQIDAAIFISDAAFDGANPRGFVDELSVAQIQAIKILILA